MIFFYEKPTCSKCTAVRQILTDAGVPFRTVDHFQERLSTETIRTLLAKLKCDVRDIVRWDETRAPEQKLAPSSSDERLIAALAEYPELLQRPIVVLGDRAMIARPPERVKEFLAGR
jgi:arsenate reductase